MKYQNNISVDGLRTGHVQGIAVDEARKYMYYSFTTCLVKTDMEGNVVGTVKGLVGHLGCIAYCEADGRVYGSLEYKNDGIGRGILNATGCEIDIQDGFYIAIFDVEKINRMDMDAEKDDVMTAVYLKEVVDDYTAEGHRYGCSGIDGTTFAPMPGNLDCKKYLYVAYGVYGDNNRADNDHQVILRYDTTDWEKYEKRLMQSNMHQSGPKKPDSKYFVYTGNTTYGIQNLEYDSYSGYMFAAVYKGSKEKFPNYSMFVIDMHHEVEEKALKGLDEEGETLFLAAKGEYDVNTGIYGSRFPYGSTGMISLGDGYFYFSHDRKTEDGYGTTVKLHKYHEIIGMDEENHIG